MRRIEEELNDDTGRRLEELRMISLGVRPSGWSRLIDAYHRSKQTGQSVTDEFFGLRWPPREPTPQEIGQRAKARILGNLQAAGLTTKESLILKRRDINSNPENSPIWTVDLILDQHGITQFIEDGTIESHGLQVPVLVTREIPVEDYPKYSELANAAIQRHIDAQKPH